MIRPATIVISDWLANCQVGQWTPFEAATALKAALKKEGYSIVETAQYLSGCLHPGDQPDDCQKQSRCIRP